MVDEHELELLVGLEDAAGRRAARRLLGAGSFPSPPQAAIIVLTSPAAPPSSADRRVTAPARERGVSSSLESRHSRRSTASCTGSRCDIFLSSLWGRCLRRHCYRSQKAVSTSPALRRNPGDSCERPVCSRCERSRSSPRRCVMADVAKLAGVSNQTVSRVINDSDHVASRTRERVMRAMDMLDYRPNSLARALVTGRSRTIGVVSFDTTLYGPASTLFGIERAAHQEDYGTSIVSALSLDRPAVLDAVARLRGAGRRGHPRHRPAGHDRACPAARARRLPVVAVEAGEGAVPARVRRPVRGRGGGHAAPARARPPHGAPHRRPGGLAGVARADRGMARGAGGGRRDPPPSRRPGTGAPAPATSSGAACWPIRRSPPCSWPTTTWRSGFLRAPARGGTGRARRRERRRLRRRPGGRLLLSAAHHGPAGLHGDGAPQPAPAARGDRRVPRAAMCRSGSRRSWSCARARRRREARRARRRVGPPTRRPAAARTCARSAGRSSARPCRRCPSTVAAVRSALSTAAGLAVGCRDR